MPRQAAKISESKRKEIKKRKTTNFTCKSIQNMKSHIFKKNCRQKLYPLYNKNPNKNQKRVSPKKFLVKEKTLKENKRILRKKGMSLMNRMISSGKKRISRKLMSLILRQSILNESQA